MTPATSPTPAAPAPTSASTPLHAGAHATESALAPGPPQTTQTPQAAPLPERETLTGLATDYWQRLPDGRLQCDVCPRHCRMSPGQRGLCFVRGATDTGVVLTSYGRAAGFCLDPIEKKPLAHFLPGTAVLSFGTTGCNLACNFCQNWDVSKSRAQDRLLAHASPDEVAEAARRTGARSVAFTYNDPVIFMEYAIAVAQACHARDLRTVAVTAGYINPAPRQAFFSAMDAANVDLKAFTERFYREHTKSELQPVLDTLVYLAHETSVWLEITTLLIPGENDSDAELTAMTRWLAEHVGRDVPLHFSAFHPDYRMRDKPPTPPATLARARDIALAAGLRYVYVGNVQDPSRQSTWCPGCGQCLIARDWHQLKGWQLDAQGTCTGCGLALPGVFEARPGDWGRKRVPVNIVGQVIGQHGAAPVTSATRGPA